MITSEQMAHNAIHGPNRQKQSILPPEFEGIDAVSIDLAAESNVKEKPHLAALWVCLPTRPETKMLFQMYSRMGYRIAKPEDMDTRDDGSLGCLIPFNEDAGQFEDGDTVLMVCDKRLALGYKKTDFLRANAPLWNDQQRRDAAAQTPNIAARFDTSQVSREVAATTRDEIKMSTVKATRQTSKN